MHRILDISILVYWKFKWYYNISRYKLVHVNELKILVSLQNIVYKSFFQLKISEQIVQLHLLHLHKCCKINTLTGVVISMNSFIDFRSFQVKPLLIHKYSFVSKTCVSSIIHTLRCQWSSFHDRIVYSALMCRNIK